MDRFDLSNYERSLITKTGTCIEVYGNFDLVEILEGDSNG